MLTHFGTKLPNLRTHVCKLSGCRSRRIPNQISTGSCANRCKRNPYEILIEIPVYFVEPECQNELAPIRPGVICWPYGNIPNRILKLTAKQIAPVLQFIFKQSFDQGLLPEDWRKANVAAIYKKGVKTDPANYRPISLTSVCCKLMEHILDSQLMKHLSSHSIITDYQHAFRQDRSCDTQLIATIHDLATNHKNKETCDIAILDFSKAFDVVPHQKLLHKLHMYGIRNKNLEWIKTFLTRRHQRTLVNGVVNLSRLALHSYCRVMYRPSYTCMRGRLVHRTSSMGRSHSGAHAPCNVTQGLGYIYSGKAHNRQLLLGSLQTLDVVHKFLLAIQLSIGGKTRY